MKHYIGTKQVEAEPMSKGEAYEKGLLKAGVVPSEEESSIMGYHVRYKDGYESWSPKDVFEKAYKVSETPLDRMRIEGEELMDRIARLQLFIHSDKFKELDKTIQTLMRVQLQFMKNYNEALVERMAIMEDSTAHNKDLCGFPFSVAISLLENGACLRRMGWNGKGIFVCKQVPDHVPGNIIPRMRSLPQAAKDRILKGQGFIDYTSQCLIYNENTGRADSWVPSISDVFADDWEVVE
jgi:hypothetical protein